MPVPILATKLHIPPPRPGVVLRPRLIERLNEGLQGRLILVSAAAGCGKTTLISEWLAGRGGVTPPPAAAWLSLDAGDHDPARFWAYVIAALQTLAPGIGTEVLAALASPQPPPTAELLTVLLNEIAAMPQEFILILDDYHLVDAEPVDQALAFLLEHQPPQMHLVIATREDPRLPLARLRARGQMTELRAADLRFTPAEAAEFLNPVMGLNLSAGDIAALETRTEGWIAGLQLAAISMQGHPDTASFIKSFTGSHRFVLDYLVEEVLGRQPASVQAFLLRTSILERMCGPLCDAVLHGDASQQPTPAASGQETLEYLEHANLFVVPLDNERRWYRYHHLFAELLRQRLGQSLAPEAIAEYHLRAGQWFEDHGLELEAFQHATAANDVERAERILDGKGLPLYALGVVTAILNWLDSLPKTVMDARPWLWVRSATSELMAGRTSGVEEKLQAAEREPCRMPPPMRRPATCWGKSLPSEPRWLSSATSRRTRSFRRAALWSTCSPITCPTAAELSGRWGLLITSRGTVPRPANCTPKPWPSARHPGTNTTRYCLPPAWAKYRKPKTSSMRRLRPTGAPCNCSATRDRRMPAKSTLGWRGSATNGTIWRPPSSTGSKACSWRGCMTV